MLVSSAWSVVVMITIVILTLIQSIDSNLYKVSVLNSVVLPMPLLVGLIVESYFFGFFLFLSFQLLLYL